MKKLSQQDVDKCRCAANHSGNRSLVASGDRSSAQCQGCGVHYSADEILAAIAGRTARHLGEGGVARIDSAI